MRHSAHLGLTLVEVLVTISIIGILMAILLPAVQATREAARRSTCLNHVRQINLALMQYSGTHQTFPPGALLLKQYQEKPSNQYDSWDEAASNLPGSKGTSWMLAILPYIEQKNLYDQWDQTRSVLANQALAAVDIPLFYCPTRRSSLRGSDISIMFQNWERGGTDYGGCIGRGNAWNNQLSAKSRGHRFLCWNTLRESKYRGIFVPIQPTHPERVFDGLSNTFTMGELQRLVPKRGSKSYERTNATSNDGWAAAGASNLFTTMIEGNSGDKGSLGGFNNGFYEAAGSEHPTGANFGFGDGAARFLKTNIDPTIYSYMGSIVDGKVFDPPF